MSVVLRQGGAFLDHFGLSTIGLITPNPGFFPMQQIRQHRRVSNIGRRGHRRCSEGLGGVPRVRRYSGRAGPDLAFSRWLLASDRRSEANPGMLSSVGAVQRARHPAKEITTPFLLSAWRAGTLAGQAPGERRYFR